jgi:hypothetical protein
MRLTVARNAAGNAKEMPVTAHMAMRTTAQKPMVL